MHAHHAQPSQNQDSENGDMETALAYLRVSTERQHENSRSLDQQLGEIETYCQDEGYELAEVHRDVISGEEQDRAGFYELLVSVKNGGADVVVAYDVDRYGRNLHDHATLLSTVKEAGIRLETSTSQQDFVSNPEKELFYGVKGLLSQYKNQTRVREAQRGKKNAAENGYWARGRPPTGYTTRGTQGSRRLVETEAAPLVCEVYERYADGASQHDLAAWCQAEHADLMPISQMSISSMLRRPTYLGLVPYRDVWYEGQHEAIVPDGLWMQVQAILTEKHKAYSRLWEAQTHD